MPIERLTLNTMDGCAPGLHLFFAPPGGHVVCLQILSVFPETNTVTVLEMPTVAVNRKKENRWKI